MTAKNKLGYLQFDGTEFGPFTLPELEKVLETGKIKGQLYVWFNTLENWMPVENAQEVSNLFEGTLSQAQKHLIKHQKLEVMQKREERNTNRVPLIATISLLESTAGKTSTHLKETPKNLGICADISDTGMQIIVTNGFAFTKGSKHKFQITPLSVSGLQPFQMTGEVMWVNAEEGRAGFRFADKSLIDIKLLNRYLDEYRRKKAAAEFK